MVPFSSIVAKIAPLAAALVLASCTVVVEDRPPPVMPGPQFCPQIFDPVCAQYRGDRQTFPNACEAERAGYRIIRGGACGRPAGGPGGPGMSPRPEPPQFCTREYRPVCARRGGDVRTFGNACEAEAARYRIIRPGQC